MRVTNRLLADRSIEYLSESLSDLAEIQRKGGSGKAYGKPSDNPTVTAEVYTLKSTIKTAEMYLNNAITTKNWMETSDSSLQKATDLVAKAVNLVLTGINGSKSQAQRETLGVEINGLLEQAVDLGNTKYLDRYIFSGYKTTTEPFVAGSGLVGSYSNMITWVNFAGGSDLMIRDIGPGESITMNVSGLSTFHTNASGSAAQYAGLYNSLIAARDIFLTSGSMSETDFVTLAGSALVGLQAASDTINYATTTNGARIRNIEDSSTRMEANQIDLKALISKKEDIDLAEVASELTLQETIYRSVIQITGSIASMPNLFNTLG